MVKWKNMKGGEKKITIILDDELWKQIKIAAIEKEKSLQEYVEELIKKEVKRYTRK